ncbi:UNVERIFIED_CONTAM: hypothetical protein Sindi_1464500 [Sesamum indicum]
MSNAPRVTFYKAIEKDLLHLSVINEDDGHLKDDSSSSTPRLISSVAPIMVTNTTTLEEQIANLMKALEVLAKHFCQINKLMNKIDRFDVSHVLGKQIEAHGEAETSLRQQSNERKKS